MGLDSGTRILLRLLLFPIILNTIYSHLWVYRFKKLDTFPTTFLLRIDIPL